MIYMLHFFNREYVVDLVGEPGNVHGPDSSINGAYLASIPTPFQISHLKECQSPYVDGEACSQSANSNHSSINPESHWYSGILCSIDLKTWSSNCLELFLFQIQNVIFLDVRVHIT